MSLAFAFASPNRMEAQGRARMVTLPGVEGDFGVLAGHAPVVALLRMGVATIEAQDGSQRRLFVRSGVAQAQAETLNALVDDAFDLDAADRADLETRLRDAKDDLSQADKESARAQRARAEYVWLEAVLAAL